MNKYFLNTSLYIPPFTHTIYIKMFFIICVLLLKCCSCNKLLKIQEQTTNNLSNCINNLIKPFINESDLILIENSINLPKIPSIQASLTKELNTFSSEKFQMYILNIKNSENLEYKINFIRNQKAFNSRAKLLIIVHNSTNTTTFPVILNNHYMYNTFIIKQLTTKLHYIYGYNFYCNGSVTNICPEAKLINKCSNGQPTIDSNGLSDVKLPKLWPKTKLKAVYSLTPPYTTCLSCKYNKGIVIDLFDVVAKELNVEIEYIYMPTLSYRGRKRHRHYRQLLYLLEKRWAHLLLGFHKPDYEEHIDFDMTCASVEDSEHFVVPHSSKIPYWKRIAAVFHPNTILTLILLCILIVVIFYYVYNASFLIALAIFVQILVENPSRSFLKLPKHISCRLILTLWLFGALTISQTFKNRLMLMLLMSKYDHQVDSLKEIANSNMPIYWQLSLDEDFYKLNENSLEEKIYNRFIYSDDVVLSLNLTAFSKNCISSVFRRTFFHYSPKYFNKDSGEPLLHLVSERIASWHAFFYFTKGYPLYEQINSLLMHFKANGFIFSLYEKYKYLSKSLFFRNINIEMNNFTLKNLLPAFYVLVSGQILALVVFLTEYMHFYYWTNW